MTQSNEITYTQQQIQSILNILDEIEVKGIGNMNKILSIINVLNEPFVSISQVIKGEKANK